MTLRHLAVLAPLGLLVAAPSPAASWHALLMPDPAEPVAPAVHLVALVAWVLAAWLLLLVGATWLSQAGGAAGRVGLTLCRRLAPTATRSAVRLVLGLTVLGASGTAHASAAPVPPSPATTAGAADSWDWPGLTPHAQAAPVASGPARPTAPATNLPARHTVPRPSEPQPTTPRTPAPRAATPTTALPTSPAAGQVVVRPGDCLWGLAAQDLAHRQHHPATAAQVAHAWPAWWQANRAVIGADPDLLLPGTPLTVPTP